MLIGFAAQGMIMALGMWASNALQLATAGNPRRQLALSTSALLASTITTTFGLAGLAFVASRKGHQVLAAFLAAVVWLFIAFNYLLWRWS